MSKATDHAGKEYLMGGAVYTTGEDPGFGFRSKIKYYICNLKQHSVCYKKNWLFPKVDQYTKWKKIVKIVKIVK